MTHAYIVRYFNKEQAQMGIQFEGMECYNFPAPFKNGVYLAGQELEDAIQAMYPYSLEERLAIISALVGGDDIEAKVVPLAQT